MGKSLNDWRGDAEYFSQAASETNRTLALGGLAIIWIFKNESGDGPVLSQDLFWPLTLLTLSLALDLLHYLAGAWIWHRFAVYHEQNTKEKKQSDISAPIWKRRVVSSFFYFKIVAMISAYILLIIVLFNKLF